MHPIRVAVLTISLLVAGAAGASGTTRRIVPHDLVLLSTLTVNLNSSSTGTTPIFTVTGTVTLGGGLILNVTGAPFPLGNTYILIDNDAAEAVIGTFAGLPEGAIITSGGQSFRITYSGGTGNDVVLAAVATPVPALDPIALAALAVCIALVAVRAST